MTEIWQLVLVAVVFGFGGVIVLFAAIMLADHTHNKWHNNG